MAVENCHTNSSADSRGLGSNQTDFPVSPSPLCRSWRPSDRGRTLETPFCLGVFTEQPGAPNFPPPTCSPNPAGCEKLFCGRLRSGDDEVLSETNLLPLYSCASTPAKSTQATRSGCSYDRLVFVHRDFGPVGRSLRKLLCVAVGKTERRVLGRLYGLTNVTKVCVDIFTAVLSLTRPTGAVPSTASE